MGNRVQDQVNSLFLKVDRQRSGKSNSIDTGIEIRVKLRKMLLDDNFLRLHICKRETWEASSIVWPVLLFPQMFIQFALKTWTYCALSVKR